MEDTIALVRVDQEGQVGLGKHRRARIATIAGHRRQGASIVVGAVAVRAMGHRTKGVFCDPHVVGEPCDVIKRWSRDRQAA